MYYVTPEGRILHAIADALQGRLPGETRVYIDAYGVLNIHVISGYDAISDLPEQVEAGDLEFRYGGGVQEAANGMKFTVKVNKATKPGG